MRLFELMGEVMETRWVHQRNWKSTASNIKDLEQRLGGDLPITKINEKTIKSLVSQWHQEGLKPATINRKLSTLRTALVYAQEEGYIQVIPRFNKVRTRENNGRMKVFSRPEEKAIVAALRGPESTIGALVVTLVDTGLRLSEALRLTPEHIDFDTNRLHVWKSKNDQVRAIPMTKRVCEIMENRKENDMIFPMSAEQVKYRWRLAREALGKAQQPDWVIHALRHTYASRLVQAGVPIYTVKTLCGHSSITTTERYAHLYDASLQHAINQLETKEAVPPSYHV